MGSGVLVIDIKQRHIFANVCNRVLYQAKRTLAIIHIICAWIHASLSNASSNFEFSRNYFDFKVG